MTLHLSYEIIFHVGGLKLAVIDIASSLLKVIQFFLDNRKIVFYLSSTCPSESPTSQMLEKLDFNFVHKNSKISDPQGEVQPRL